MRREAVLSKLQILSRALVLLCFRNGIKLGELLDALKRSYVSVAEETLIREGNDVSNSRVTLMTGVHRTDVAAIRSEKDFAPRERSTASDVIGQWRYNPQFSTRAGRPRSLTVEGKESEFAELVRSVSSSVSSYTVLFELERLEMVERTKDGKIRLVSRLFVPKGDPGAVLDMLGEDAVDLFLAVEENAFVEKDQTIPHHHVKTSYENVPREHLQEIREWFMKQGSAFHERARNYLSQFDRDVSPSVKGTGRCRVSVLSSSYSTVLEPSNEDTHL